MRRVASLLIKQETIFNVVKLLKMIQKNDSLAVIMYGSPDPDAIASALALREIVSQRAGLARSIFLSTEPASRYQNIEVLRAMKVHIQLLSQAEVQNYRLIALVDCQPAFFGDALGEIIPQIVLDHHPPVQPSPAELSDLRKNYGALSTVMTEYLLAAKIRIPRLLHTALLYGIKTDTNNFERDARIEDISAYHFNFARANRQLLRRFELNQIPDRFLKYFDHAYHHKHRFRERIVCFLGKVESADACVQVADFYLRLVGVYYVVVAGIFKEKLVIIFRGDGYRQDCGTIAVGAFGAYGNAGGHKSAARVEIPLESLESLLPDGFTQEAVDTFLLERLREKGMRPAS